MFVEPIRRIRAEIKVPGDKSISHRAAIIAAIAEGESVIENFLPGEDCLGTLRCLEQLGVEFYAESERTTVRGVGDEGLQKPGARLDAGNSGTTIRLLSGLLCGQSFGCELTGDASLRKRPMNRVILPLRLMGADISSVGNNGRAPLRIRGSRLRGIEYQMPVASAQVKSALLLAALYAEGVTRIIEPVKTRNHTELMLRSLGADVAAGEREIICRPGRRLKAGTIIVPGDISSAAFFLVLGTIADDGEIYLPQVGLNPTRTGVIEVLREMGANIEISNLRIVAGEARGDLRVRSSPLRGVEIGKAVIPRLIDEIPVLAAAACYAVGTTVIRDAQELRVKESNRIRTVVRELGRIGADIRETPDGMIVRGRGGLTGGEAESHGDHRVAMALAVAGLGSREGVKINGSECVAVSYPGFFAELTKLRGEVG